MVQVGEETKLDGIVKDIFFLNMEDAYAEAKKQNKIINEKGVERLQYCYYDGPLTDIILKNFIRIPSDKFVEVFSENLLPIPQVIAVSQDGERYFNNMPHDIVADIENYRLKHKVADSSHRDTYFVDPLLALNNAKQGNRVFCGHPLIDGLQVCYYRGVLPVHDIENLVHVELDEFLGFFITSTLRLPEHLEMPDELEDELKATVKADVEHLVMSVKENRLKLAKILGSQAKQLEPVFDFNKPLRVFIPSSRLTTVMQYSSRNVAKAFENIGYEVLFYIEDNEMSDLNNVDYLSRYINFKPHIVFNINHVNNDFLNDVVINFIWWQDPMPQLLKHQPIELRDNDFNFSLSPFIDEHLALCGIHDVVRQHFVVDDDVFNTDNVVDRHEKVVFIGSSYSLYVNEEDADQAYAIKAFIDIMDSGGQIDRDIILEISSKTGWNYNFIFWRIFAYAVRDYSVRWLCGVSSIPVEIYGRSWEKTLGVSRSFMGELPHGQAVANVYKSAKYALVSHPFEISSQRLAEIMACGCIPIVYDCRKIAEQPHWDDYCLFFRNANDLKIIIDNGLMPKKNPHDLAGYFTYNGLVGNFIAKANIGRPRQCRNA